MCAATNKDLRALIQQGLFREDLFFREDIPDLVHHFLRVAVAEGLPQKYIEQAGLDRMIRYRWPGNIPELQNLIRRLAALCPQEVITERFVELELECEINENLCGQSSSPRVTFATAIEPVFTKLFGHVTLDILTHII